MRSVFVKKIAIALLAVAAVIAGLCFYKTAFATNVSFDYKYRIEQEYEINDILELPACTATYNGVMYDTTFKLYYPDGRISENVSNSLDCLGSYSVVYSFTADQEITDTKTFLVKNGYKGLFSNSDGLTVEGFCTVPEEITKEGYNACETGVKLRITKNGAKTKFNGIIDLRKSSKSVPFISFQVVPGEIQKRDFSRFFITLTDVYDENNYVVIQVQAGDSGAEYGLNYPYVTYFATQACGMYSPLGLVQNHGVYNINGTTGNHSFGGICPGWGDGAAFLCFDLDDPALYALHYGNSIRVLKYNDTSVLSAQELWGGFTTGEVYVSFEFDRLVNPAAEIIISSIGGVNIDENYYAEHTQTIIIDYGEFNSIVAVEGVKGGKYPVYNAVLYDNVDGLIFPESVKAFYGDTELPIVKGKFATAQSGDYVIEYTFDTVGTTKKHRVNVVVNDSYVNALEYSVNPDMPSVMSIGETLYVYDGEATGGIGKLSVTPRLYLNGVERQLKKGIKFFEHDIEEVGTYTLEFTVKDALDTQITVDKIITVAYNDAPVIIEPSLPEYVINGQSVILPTPKAICVTESGAQSVEVKTTIGSVDYTDKPYTPNGDFSVRYVATYSDNETVLQRDIKTLTVKSGSEYIGSFFGSSQTVVGENDVSIEHKTEDTENIYFSTDIDKAYFVFGRKVYAEGFKLVFGVDSERNNFSCINVYLTDVENKTESVKLSYVKIVKGATETISLYINDVYCTTVEGSFEATRIPFAFIINNADHTITKEDGISNICEIVSTRYGTAFKGFTSGELYVKVEFEGVTGESAIKMSELGNQLLSYKLTQDNANPVIVFGKKLALNNIAYEGQTFNVSKTVAYDILNNVSSFTVKVKDPNGTVLRDENAGSPFSIELNQKGNYKLEFVAEDESGKKLNFVRYINVIDGISPELSVTSLKTTYNVGDSLVLPQYNISDDSETVDTVIYIINCHGLSLDVSGGYKFTESGRYKLLIYARDDAYNFALEQFDIIVNGEK